MHRVACMSRFLPDVECRNLASQVLSMSLTTMAQDFEERYGHRPWLVETFVDPTPGISLRAANWIHVGASRWETSVWQSAWSTAPMSRRRSRALPSRWRRAGTWRR